MTSFSERPGGTEEFLRMRRYEQIAQAQAFLRRSLEFDAGMPRGEHTKKFVSVSGGTDRYPFPHFRIKLKPKNRIESTVSLGVLRFPTVGPPVVDAPYLHDDTVYVAWETNENTEEAFVLDTDAFSCLDVDRAFAEPNDRGGWPSIESRTRADEIKQFTLQAMLEDFEPDLQTNSPEVSS